MKRRRSIGLVLLIGALATLGVLGGSARAQWGGINDLHYDNGGRACTDGLEFSLSNFANPAGLSVTVTNTTPEPDVVLVPTTPVPLQFDPVPTLFGEGPFVFSGTFRVTYDAVPGDELDVQFTGPPGSNGIVGETVGQCTLGAPFSGFEIAGKVDDPPLVNVVKGAGPVSLRFSLGGDRGLSIFSEGPSYAAIPCGTPAPNPFPYTGEATPAEGKLDYQPSKDRYSFRWDAPKELSGCHELWFRIDPAAGDGLVHSALFDFG